MDNISERKSAVDESQKSEDKYRTLFNSTADAIVIHDLEGHFLDGNDEAVNRLGYSRDELLKLTLEEIDSPESARLAKSRTEEVLHKVLMFLNLFKRRKMEGSWPQKFIIV